MIPELRIGIVRKNLKTLLEEYSPCLVLFLLLYVKEESECEEVDELGPAEEAEAHAQTHDASEETDQVLPAVGDRPGVLHHAVILNRENTKRRFAKFL